MVNVAEQQEGDHLEHQTVILCLLSLKLKQTEENSREFIELLRIFSKDGIFQSLFQGLQEEGSL